MKATILIAILLTFSMPSLAADQWLCTEKKMTTIFVDEKGEYGAIAADSGEQFTVSEDGLKFIGSDEYHFNAEDCATDSDESIRCESKLRRQGFVQVTVFLDSAMFYRYQMVFTGVLVAHHMQTIGPCTKI